MENIFNPLAEITKQVAALEVRVQTRVEIAFIRESIRWHLSRLLTLDTDVDRQAAYNLALAEFTKA